MPVSDYETLLEELREEIRSEYLTYCPVCKQQIGAKNAVVVVGSCKVCLKQINVEGDDVADENGNLTCRYCQMSTQTKLKHIFQMIGRLFCC